MRLAPWLVMLALALGSGSAQARPTNTVAPSVTGSKKTETSEQLARTHVRRAHRSHHTSADKERAAVKSERSDKTTSAPPLPRPSPARKIAATPPVTETTPSAPPLPKPAPQRKITTTLPVANPEAPEKLTAAPPLPRPAPPRPAPAAKTAALPPVPKPIVKLESSSKLPAEPRDQVFGDIPHGERQQIQAALLWAGDRGESTKGEDPMLAAVRSYQRRNGNKVTGVLTDDERATLVAAAERYAREYGWSIVTDPATGIRIGLPTKIVPHAHAEDSGTRWSSTHGEVQIETFRVKDASLSAVYERERKKSHRTIEFNELHDNSFHISGLQGLKIFSVRATARDGEVRGFTMLYDQMMETIVEPVVVAMAHAFTPFPERSAPLAVLAKPVEYGTGLIVSAQGHIVTDRRIADGCRVIVAAGLGNAERVADDEDTGLALLRVYGAHKLAALALSSNAPTGRDVTLVGISDPQQQNGGGNISEIKARLAGGSAIELRRPVPMAGFSGAAALDRQGRVLGMLETRNVVLASIKPSLPPMRLISSGAIRAFLAEHAVSAAQTQTGDAKASVVRIICVRK
jgi:Trypsin-like peptidase domain